MHELLMVGVKLGNALITDGQCRCGLCLNYGVLCESGQRPDY
jgi:hypothetical protein